VGDWDGFLVFCDGVDALGGYKRELVFVLPQHDDQKVKEYRVSLAVKMVGHLVDKDGLRGFHFCTLNLAKSIERVHGEGGMGAAPREAAKQVNSSASRLPDH
jgi:hypothetical protein